VVSTHFHVGHNPSEPCTGNCPSAPVYGPPGPEPCNENCDMETVPVPVLPASWIRPGDIPKGIVDMAIGDWPEDDDSHYRSKVRNALANVVNDGWVAGRLILGKPDEPDEGDEADEADGVHVCKRRMIASRWLEPEQRKQALSPLSIAFANVLPEITHPRTALLMFCDGCGDYSVITLREHWTLADLDPASPAR
jgi:hypothetical protein